MTAIVSFSGSAIHKQYNLTSCLFVTAITSSAGCGGFLKFVWGFSLFVCLFCGTSEPNYQTVVKKLIKMCLLKAIPLDVV